MPSVSHRHAGVFTQSVIKDLTLLWNIRQTVTKDTTAKWNIRETVTKDLTLKWNIRQTVTKDITLKWHIRKSLTKDIRLLWNIDAGVTTASEKHAKHYGSKLKTIDSDELPERRKKVVKVAIEVSADFKAPQVAPIPLIADFTTKIGVPIPITSDSLKIRQGLIRMEADFRGPIKTPVRMEADFKQKQKTIGMEAKLSFLPIYQQIRKNLEILLGGRYQSFEISAKEWGPILTNTEELLHFKEPSSVVGLVTYDTETGEMSIFLGGNNRYDYCNVPSRIYQGFKGAGSKGAYYNRNIKGQFNC